MFTGSDERSHIGTNLEVQSEDRVREQIHGQFLPSHSMVELGVAEDQVLHRFRDVPVFIHCVCFDCFLESELVSL